MAKSEGGVITSEPLEVESMTVDIALVTYTATVVPTSHVFAQDINDADVNMSPTDAATHIGGLMIASALEVTFDGSAPCPLKAQATTEVVV